MRSFTLSVFATLAFAVFSYAAPMIAGSPVKAIAARHEEDHTKENSLEVVLTVAVDVLTPITEKLTCLTSETVSVEVVTEVVVELKAAINEIIVEVKALESLSLDKILCTLVGGVLDALSIAKLLAVIFKLVFGACSSVLAVVSVSIKVEICSLLSEVGCLIGSLLCAVLGLVNNLVWEIVACLLPQITGCLSIIKILDIKIIISVLGIRL